MQSIKEYITPSDLLMLNDQQMDLLWRWANRSKLSRPSGLGLNGMPLLSIGRCIEFLIDSGVAMKGLMNGLAVDLHDNKEELVDVLWACVRVVLNNPVLLSSPKLKWIKPKNLITKGTMVQWIDAIRWKELTESEMARLWSWSSNGEDSDKLFTNLSNRPMLSIGRLIEFLTDKGMNLKEIFQQCAVYENKEWNKLQLIDILWEKVKLMLRAAPINQKSVIDIK